MSRLALSLLPLLVIASARAEADPTRDYVIRERETCLEIAVRELGDGKRLEELHRLNPQLGPLPHHLKAGQVIKLPADVVDPDAHLTAQRGDVEVRRAGDAEWTKRETGVGLFRAWRVGARERATAQVTFRDTSGIAMRENSVVVIFGATAAQATVGSFKATLETGALRSRLGPNRKVLVETTIGQARLEQGSAVISTDQGHTRVSNHKGTAATLRGATRTKTVTIAPGQGSTVAPRQDPTPPRALPPAPTWTDTSAVLAVGWSGQGGELQVSWQGSPGAVRTHVELAHDPDLTNVELAFEVGANITTLDARSVPPGEYYLALSAIDADGLESAPSVLRAVRVLELPPPGKAAAAGGPPRVGLGTTLELPANVRCTTSSAPPSTRVVFETQGDVALRCEGSTTPLALHVAEVRVRPPAPVQLRVGDTAELVLDVAAEVAPAPLTVRVPAGVDATLVETGGVHYMTIRAHTRGVHVVHVYVGSTEVAHVDVTIEEMITTPPRPLARRMLPWLEAGTFAGATARRGVANLGLTVAVRPDDAYAVEVSGWRELGDDGATAASLGFMVTPLAERFTGRVRPRLRVGFLGRHPDGGATTLGAFAGADALMTLAAHIALVAGIDVVVVAEDADAIGFAGVRLGW